jgi:hypothetical protein
MRCANHGSFGLHFRRQGRIQCRIVGNVGIHVAVPVEDLDNRCDVKVDIESVENRSIRALSIRVFRFCVR